MKKNLHHLAIILLSLLVTACASLHTLSVTPQPKDRSNQIMAEVSKTVILAFNFENSFVNELQPKLIEQCPKGKITGIVTKYETFFYFLFYTMHVKSTGYCEKSGSDV